MGSTILAQFPSPSRGILSLVRFLSVFVLCLGFATIEAEETLSPATPDGSLTLDDILLRLVEQRSIHDRALLGFECTRVYHLSYSGIFGKRHAEMVVKASFRAPATRDFTIVSEEGSELIRNRVFRKMMEAEKEAAQEENRLRAAISPSNYRFAFDGSETTSNGLAYVLTVEPLTDNKFLFRGKIWINAADFAIQRVEAEPARNPSFWTRRSVIQQTYERVGGFWLPMSNHTVSNIRFGGRAVLTVEYKDYHINEVQTTEQAHSSTAN